MMLLKGKYIVNFTLVTLTVTICIIGIGCDDPDPNPVNKSQINAELIGAMNDIAMENAIITQHTLYPYHFVNNSDKLNDLGQRDLAVLANHFKQNPGQLNVRQDGTVEQLYQARIAFVAEQLKKDMGVDSDIKIADGMPGGSGMSSESVLEILESNKKARSQTADSYMESRTTD